MKKYLSAVMTLGICMAIAAPAALAQASASAPSTATKKTAKKAPAKKAAPAKIPDNPDDEGEPDVAGSASDDYQCELGNQLTIYHNAADDKHIGLRWNK